MLTINAKLEGHRLTITGTPQLAADSARVDRVKFDFDDEWAGFSRVALFWGSDGEEPYAVAVDGQGYAVIPWETIQEKGRMRFGVYGIKGTSRITSTVLKYQIQDGAWSASPANPGEITPTMLEQLQALVETAVEQMDDRLAEFDAAVETFFPHRGGVGSLVTVEGTVDASPAGLTIYGRSVQDGTPAPDVPADIVTAGSSGSLPMVSVAAGTNIHNSATDTAQFIDENGNITDNADYLLTDYIPLSGNYLYIRWEDVVGTACYLRRAYYDSNKSFIRRDIHQLTRGQSGTFWTPLATARYVRICVENSSTNRISGLQVHDGYGVAIPTPNGLPGIPVASGGNYTDTNGQMWICDTIDLEAGTWTKRCGVVTLDDSRTYTLDSSGAFYTQIDELIRATDYRSEMLCDRLTVVEYNGTVSGTVNSISGYRNDPTVYQGQNWIYFNVENISTLADLTTWLGTHPIKVVYVLAAPVVTQLTEAQIAALRALRGRKGLTNLYSADPAGPEFRAEMYIDIPTYIKDLVAANGNTMVFSVSE